MTLVLFCIFSFEFHIVFFICAPQVQIFHPKILPILKNYQKHEKVFFMKGGYWIGGILTLYSNPMKLVDYYMPYIMYIYVSMSFW